MTGEAPSTSHLVREYRSLLDALPVGILIHQDFTIRYANQQVADMVGVEEPGALLGEEVLDFIPDEERSTARRRIRRVQEERETAPPIQYRVRRPDGGERIVEAQGWPVTYREAPAVQTIVRDITEETRARRRLEVSERRYRALFEQNVAGVFRSTPDGEILDCNQALAEIFGYDSPGELTEMPAAELYPSPEARVRFIEKLDRDGSVENYAHRLRRRTGDTIWVLENAQLTEDPEAGGAVILGTLVDITDRVRAEEELRAAEERYRLLVEHNVAGVFRISLDGEFLDCNDAFARMFGYEAPDALREMAAEDLYADPDNRMGFKEDLLEHGVLKNYELRLRRRDGDLIWGLENSHLTEEPDRDGPVIVGTLIDITERKKLQAELERRAYHDPLTGLPNRRLLRERARQALELARRQERRVGMLFIDLKRFKLVNDSFGHAAGDRVLVEVGKRLSARVRAADTPARIGGDEFVVLLAEVDGTEGALTAGRRILEIFRRPFQVKGSPVHLEARLGLALYPDHASEVDELLTRADRALVYSEKRDQEIGVYSPAADDRPELELTVAEALRAGLEREDFSLHYQPVYRLSDLEMAGVEALLRWAGPDGRMWRAGEFIPTAERAGLVAELDRWALRAAARELRRWPGPVEPGWVAVNLSAATFSEPALADEVARLCEETGTDPARLVLEITERSAMRDPERTFSTVERLREVGVRIAIDDFGTGYSALAHLKHYPADLLKIDMIFVRQGDREAEHEDLIRAIVDLGHALGTEVVAEGIEDRRELERLAGTRCDYGQGYHLGKPAPPEELQIGEIVGGDRERRP